MAGNPCRSQSQHKLLYKVRNYELLRAFSGEPSGTIKIYAGADNKWLFDL